MSVTVYGAAYSVYTRIVRLVLEEIGVPYALVEIDIFAKERVPPDYTARHPFGKIPSFEYDNFRLFETDAIARYAVDTFGGDKLIPEEPRPRARMTQIMRIMDNYAYSALVWGVFVEEVERGRAGCLTDEKVAQAGRVLDVLEPLADRTFLVGSTLTLADLWAVPMIAYFRLAPSGQSLMSQAPKLSAWWSAMAERESVRATRFAREGA